MGWNVDGAKMTTKKEYITIEKEEDDGTKSVMEITRQSVYFNGKAKHFQPTKIILEEISNGS